MSAGSDPVVTAVDLTRVFGAFTAVDAVSFEVAPGEVFGFLGSNGAGKTTTIRMLCGLLAPSAGSASVAGFDIATEPLEVQRRIGYMSQRFSLYTDIAVEENLRFWASAYGLLGDRYRRRRDWALELTDLGQHRKALVRDLPGGIRQRLALSCALLHEPPVVFLDEPTGGVDPQMRRRFWDLIDDLAASGTTVFVTTHFMDEAERCHRVALMDRGRLLALDTTSGLTDRLGEGSVVEVTDGDPVRIARQLEGAEGVLDAALLGDRVHVLVPEGSARETVTRALADAGVTSPSITPVRPTLEDVFLHTIHSNSDPGDRRGAAA